MFYCRRIEMAVYCGVHFVMSTFLCPSHHLCVLLTNTLRSNFDSSKFVFLRPIAESPLSRSCVIMVYILNYITS
jgi:hypothetical protein